jgi:3-hydroxybutyryl-CoA dehydratase
MLTAGLISAVLGMYLPGPGTIYLSQSLRFTKPVRIGERVTASAEIVEIMAEKRRVRLATAVHNQNDDLVLEGEAIVMVTES